LKGKKAMPLSNDTLQLVPETTISSERQLHFDFPALKIGIAEYSQAPTGCTVFYFPDGVKTAVDIRGGAAGAVHDRAGNVVRGNFNPESHERLSALKDLERRLELKEKANPRQGNTTLSLVVTNLKLSREELTQVARQVNSSMARVIQPFATMDDGDVLYAVTTNEVEYIGATSLGLLASELAWDAVLSIYKP
jgi:L-aminopeptidase/D-esterase-like protein